MSERKKSAGGDHLWRPFTQAATAPVPLAVVGGDGAYLTGRDGTRYLDLISSWWVTLHGHAQPDIAAAIAAQASTLEHVIFADTVHEPALSLAASLSERLPGGMNRVFFSDNGSTAVEVALKMALQYFANTGARERTGFLCFEGGYHGDTAGAMSVGHSSGFYEAYRPMMFPVGTVPFAATWQGDDRVEEKECAALAVLDEKLARDGGSLAAIIVEPLVQGAAGMRMCRPEFIATVAERVRRAGALVIFDEVFTGFGRTGTLFAAEQIDCRPDVICLAKGLTGGFLPLAATVAREPVYEAFLGEGFSRALAHGHSFAGNPLGCAAANASLALFDREDVLTRVGALGRWLETGLQSLAGVGGVRRVRRTGVIAAFDVGPEQGYGADIGQRLKAAFLARGLVLRPLGNTVYLVPPYCIEEEDIARAFGIIREIIEGTTENGAAGPDWSPA